MQPTHTLAVVERSITTDSLLSVGQFGEFQLASHFQPVFSLAHGRAVGFEALLRATDPNGKAVAPLEIFHKTDGSSQTVLLDRLCRAIHVRNFVSQQNGSSCWLFLNVNPQVVIEGTRFGAFFQDLLDRSKLSAHQVVIEILEAAVTEEEQLSEAVSYYRDLGCLIAIDDFGAGHSNFDRIWRLRPDIVKFDRSIVTQAANDHAIRAVVAGMVSLVHEAGSLVAMEGIESELEAMIAMDANVDFVQGYYFARPVQSLADKAAALPLLNHLFDQFKRVLAVDHACYRNEIAPYINGLGYSSALLGAGQPLEVSCAGFLELPRAERCFLLDINGQQIGGSVVSPHLQVNFNPRYAPLNDASGANWSHRHYFRRALSRPEKVHVTRPYLSGSTATQCVTVSIAIKIAGNLHVLCGDVSRSRGILHEKKNDWSDSLLRLDFGGARLASQQEK